MLLMQSALAHHFLSFHLFPFLSVSHEFYHDISNHIAPPTTDAGTGTKRGRRQPLGDFADSIGSIDARAVDKRFKEPNQIIGKNSGMGHTKRTRVWGPCTDQKTSKGGGKGEGGGGVGTEPFSMIFFQQQHKHI